MTKEFEGAIIDDRAPGERRAKIRAAAVAEAAWAIDEAPSAQLGASPSSPAESIPLLRAQRALWLHHASAPDSSV
jgi:hypothetical protein